MDIYYLVSVFEFIAAIIASIYFKRYVNSKEKYFLYFLWLTFIVDIAGGVLGDCFLTDPTIIYNIFMIIGFIYYLFWYYSIIKRKQYKSVIRILIILLILFIPFDVFLINWNNFYNNIFFIGTIFTIIATLLHFLQLLNSNEMIQIERKLSFWISTGVLLFNVGMIPYFYLSDYLAINTVHRKIILVGLNFILYGCYTLGFIWNQEKTETYS